MTRGDDGWWTPAEPVPSTDAAVDYGYLLDDDPDPRPDPRSRRQPGGRARAVAAGRDDVRVAGLRLDRPPARRLGDLRAARRHVHARSATSTPRSSRLDHLLDLGVDLVEVMPVNAFNGTHNWGYDGVGWFAVHEQYGGPDAYKRFVDACHAKGLGVVQDVVHNHLGPSGNYLPLFGPYLKPGRNTWGDLINLDGEDSAEVRRYILDNVRMWFEDFHVDALAARRGARAQRHLRGAPPRGDGDRDRRLLGPRTPPADPDRGVRPQRHAARHARARPAATASTPSGATTSTTPSTSR